MSLAVSVDAFSHPPHDNALFRRVLEHAMAALEDAQVSSEPYCHFYAENVLPTDFFRELIANFPDRSNYVPLNLKVWVRENGESTRDRLVFTEELFGRLSEEQCLFWRTVTDVLASDKLRQTHFACLLKTSQLDSASKKTTSTKSKPFPGRFCSAIQRLTRFSRTRMERAASSP